MPGQPEKLAVEILVQVEELLHIPVRISFRLALEDFPKARNARVIHGDVPQGRALDGLPDKLGLRNPPKIHQ
jgi:hypothetical protein